MQAVFLALAAVLFIGDGDPLEEMISDAPSEGVLYAVVHPTEGAGQEEQSRLVAVCLDGSQQASWNNGTLFIEDRVAGTSTRLWRRGDRFVDAPAIPGGRPPGAMLTLGRLTHPLIWPYVVATMPGGGARVTSVVADEDRGIITIETVKSSTGAVNARIAVSATDPKRLVGLTFVGPRGSSTAPVMSPAADRPWLAHLNPEEGTSVEVFIDADAPEITPEWMLRKEAEHQLRLSSQNLRAGGVRPLWDDPRFDGEGADGPINAVPDEVPIRETDGFEAASGVAIGRFDDSWRPSEGDATTPGAPQSSGFQQWLVLAAGGTLVAFGVALVLVRKIRG